MSTKAPAAYHASQSLSANPKPAPSKASASSSFGVQALAKKIREKAPIVTETYVAYGAARTLVQECGRPGDYKIPEALEKSAEIPTDEDGTHIGQGTGWWYDALGLKPTFFNWAQITFIHMYMLQVRFRMLPQSHAQIWIQHLTNQAFYSAEDRLVVWHKFNANSLRQKQLKDMFAQWRGVLLSYDEGLMKGDAMLAAAIWRNLLSAKKDVDFQKLAQIVGYMRRELKRLDDASDDEVVAGTWKFKGDPGDEASLLKSPSKMMMSGAAKA